MREDWMIDAPYPAHCVEWQGKRNTRGYGVLPYVPGRSVMAHRHALAYKLGRPILPGYFACHHCDNPACFNPGHLFEGTPKENSLDMVQKGRFSQPNRKFSEGDVRLILARCNAGEKPTQIAREFGVTQNAVFNILRGITWRHVTGLRDSRLPA